MAFAAVYIPNFSVQAVVRVEPELLGRAVALVDGHPPLWKVVAANEAAVQAGIESSMGGSQAKQFCAVEIRQRSTSLEKIAQAALLDIGWSVSPRIENTAPGTIVIDLTGLTSLFQSVKIVAGELKERVSSVGLLAHVAVGSNIEVAVHAARGFAGITLIPLGHESARLSSLPVDVLFPSAEILETLDCWGIRTCGALAELPVPQLSERLGQEGIRLCELARGTSVRALHVAEPETCFTEEMTLDYAVTELEPLAFLLGRLLDQLCARLQARSLAAASFCLRFDLEDPFEKDPESQAKPSFSMTDAKTYEKTLALPVAMRNSKMLLKLLRLQLQSDPPHGSIVKIILTAEPARPRAAQSGLFVPESPDPEKLEVTIARLAILVGDSNVGSPQLMDTHRPGEFRMVRFAPVAEESRVSHKVKPTTPPSKSHPGTASRFSGTAIAFRTFRPEFPAQVESREGCPCRICFRGLRGTVVAASGPWRTSGDWWREAGWRQDEWDLEIRFDSFGGGHRQASRLGAQDGLYRIYYDWIRQGWFVRGRYD